jgi:Zn-dependent peptidase ImmA (M78 family)/transcriptional regulator with XRE-family HTH domain
MSTSQGWLSRVEAGLRGVQPEQLQKLSEVLNYPPEFFFQKENIVGLGVPALYHRMLQSVGVKELRRIHAQIYLRTLNIKRLLSGFDIGELKIHPLNLDDYDGKPKEIARVVRASWKLPQGPVLNLVASIENSGGIVIPLEFNSRKVDAVAHWPPGMPPLFFINVLNPTDRLRFTLCHELGHIIMHQYSMDKDLIEHQANEFAAEFLMPRKEIMPQLIDLSLEKLFVLKQYWKVSMAAILMRARDLGTITPRKYTDFWMTLGKAGYRLREPPELDIPLELPTLQKEIIESYFQNMDYKVSELAKFLCLTVNDVKSLSLEAGTIIEKQEKKSAIKDVEKYLKQHRSI